MNYIRAGGRNDPERAALQRLLVVGGRQRSEPRVALLLGEGRQLPGGSVEAPPITALALKQRLERRNALRIKRNRRELRVVGSARKPGVIAGVSAPARLRRPVLHVELVENLALAGAHRFRREPATVERLQARAVLLHQPNELLAGAPAALVRLAAAGVAGV